MTVDRWAGGPGSGHESRVWREAREPSPACGPQVLGAARCQLPEAAACAALWRRRSVPQGRLRGWRISGGEGRSEVGLGRGSVVAALDPEVPVASATTTHLARPTLVRSLAESHVRRFCIPHGCQYQRRWQSLPAVGGPLGDEPSRGNLMGELVRASCRAPANDASESSPFGCICVHRSGRWALRADRWGGLQGPSTLAGPREGLAADGLCEQLEVLPVVWAPAARRPAMSGVRGCERGKPGGHGWPLPLDFEPRRCLVRPCTLLPAAGATRTRVTSRCPTCGLRPPGGTRRFAAWRSSGPGTQGPTPCWTPCRALVSSRCSMAGPRSAWCTKDSAPLEPPPPLPVGYPPGLRPPPGGL